MNAYTVVGPTNVHPRRLRSFDSAIDAGDVVRTFIDPGSVADARAMITDLKLLFTTGLEPQQRPGLERAGADGAAYWRLR